MTDPDLIEFVANTANTQEVACSAMMWTMHQLIAQLHPGINIFEYFAQIPTEACELDKNDNELDVLAENLVPMDIANYPYVVRGLRATMKTARLMWRNLAVLHDWVEMAKNTELTAISLPISELYISA